MSYLKLIKLLYLTDREALGHHGRVITTDRHFSMDKGPVVSRILDLATEDPVPNQSHYWNEHISAPNNYEIFLIKDAGRDELSDVEISIIEEIFKIHGSKSRWQLVKFTHTLPEWKDPNGGSIPIHTAEILNALGKTPEEVEAVNEELFELANIDKIFGSK